MSTKSLRREIQRLLQRQEAAVRNAFLAAVQDIRAQAKLTRLRNALQSGDIESAIRALNIESAAYSTFAREIGNTYTQAGAIIAAGTTFRLPDSTTAVIRFDVDNPSAREWLRTLSSDRITRITQDTIAAARVTINAGYASGYHPNRIALDLVGRIGANGRRTGGIIGLSEPQAQYVANMRRYLREDPGKYFNMTRRDRRLDGIVRRAMDAGKPVSLTDIDKIAGRYSDRLLALRGETIARTETAMAVEDARQETWRQYREKEGVPDEAIVKTWISAGPAKGGNERPDHQALHRTEVRGLETPFVMGDGTLMQHPLDPRAPVHHLANCRCTYVVGVDWAMLAR